MGCEVASRSTNLQRRRKRAKITINVLDRETNRTDDLCTFQDHRYGRCSSDFLKTECMGIQRANLRHEVGRDHRQRKLKERGAISGSPNVNPLEDKPSVSSMIQLQKEKRKFITLSEKQIQRYG